MPEVVGHSRFQDKSINTFEMSKFLFGNFTQIVVVFAERNKLIDY